MKTKKNELKNNSFIFRLVKHGSMFIYVFFHVFTIFVILLTAVMRRSLLSLGYIIILFP